MYTPDRVLIVHQGAIGDCIVSLPCFHAIRKAFPSIRCDIMGHPHIVRLVENRHYADRTLSVDTGSAASLYREDGTLDEGVRQYLLRCASVFVFGGFPHEQIVRSVRTATPVPAYRIPTRPPEGSDIHVIDYQLKGVGAAGIPADGSVPHLYLEPEDHDQAKNLLQRSGISADGLLAAIAPGSGSPRKNWPEDYFCLCLEELHRYIDIPFLIIEGPAEMGIGERIRHRCPGLRLTAVKNPSLPVLAAVIARCGLYIGNDSGITHMAAALGVPTVALFGPTDPAVWGPRGKAVRIVQSGAPGWSTPGEVVDNALRVIRRAEFEGSVKNQKTRCCEQ